MKEQFSNEENHLSDGNPICQLLVYTEDDGNVYFTCDWDGTEDGVTGVGAMLYRLSEGRSEERRVGKECRSRG